VRVVFRVQSSFYALTAGGVMMGRRAKPVELHVLGGNRSHLTKAAERKRREAEEAIRPPADNIKCPAWLGRAGKSEWKRVIQSLKNSKLMTNVDVASLAVYCDAVDKFAEASKAVTKQGVTLRIGIERRMMDNGDIVEINSGRVVQNPNCLVATKYAQVIARYARQFGLDPSARAGLAIPKAEDKPKDHFEELFGSGKNGRRSG